MIIIKTTKGVFREKAPEWVLSIGCLIWGLIIFSFPNLFSNSAYKALLSIMPQILWAYMAILVGVFRICVLAATCRYKWGLNAHFRAAGAVGGVTVWVSLFIVSLLNFSERGSGIATFGMLLALDLLALWWSSGDAKLIDQAKSKKE